MPSKDSSAQGWGGFLFVIFLLFVGGGFGVGVVVEEARLSCMSRLPVRKCVAGKEKKKEKNKSQKNPPPLPTKTNNKISWDC